MIKCSECICCVNNECHRHAPTPVCRLTVSEDQWLKINYENIVIWPRVYLNPGCCDGILKPEILRQMMKDVSKELDDVIAKKKATIEEIECLKKIKEAQEILRNTK